MQKLVGWKTELSVKYHLMKTCAPSVDYAHNKRLNNRTRRNGRAAAIRLRDSVMLVMLGYIPATPWRYTLLPNSEMSCTH